MSVSLKEVWPLHLLFTEEVWPLHLSVGGMTSVSVSHCEEGTASASFRHCEEGVASELVSPSVGAWSLHLSVTLEGRGCCICQSL